MNNDLHFASLPRAKLLYDFKRVEIHFIFHTDEFNCMFMCFWAIFGV